MRRSVSLSAVLAVVAIGIGTAHAADVAPAAKIVRMGDGTVDARKIAPYDNAFVATQIFPGGRLVHPGIWTDQMRLRDVHGRKLLVRTQSLAYYDGRFLSSVNVFDPVSFAPVSDIQHNPDGSTEKWTFDGSHVEGHLTAGTPGAKEEVRKFDFPAPFYDFNCCMRSIVQAALPLKPGFSVIVPAFEGTGTLSQVHFKAIGREKVHAGWRGTVDAQVVETPLLGGYIRFWIIDKPPYMVRMTLSANSVNPYAQSFDMIAPGPFVPPPPMPDAFGHGEPKSP
ncbi:MAG TPA: hypothetical protein VLW75_03380 [Rhizomicrobium sp.]|nr:hypothetical protein [Rhizomicrobium sp.]